MAEQKLFIAMYHYVRDLSHSRYPEIKGLDVELFRKQMEFFRENFTVVRMEQVIESVKTGKSLPERSVLLTFDDGYTDHYTFAFPVLEEFGFQGSFFIPGSTFTEHRLLDVNKIHFILACADIAELVEDVKKSLDHYRSEEYDYPSTEELWKTYAKEDRFDGKEVVFVKRILQMAIPEKVRSRMASDLFEKHVGISEEKMAYELYMTREQIRTLKRHGMYIGLHGYDHYWLGELPEKEMHRDIDTALDTMDEFINKNEWVMNYPYGSYSDEVTHYIAEKGACLGLTTDVCLADLKQDEVLLLPRMDCNDFPPKSEKYKKYL